MTTDQILMELHQFRHSPFCLKVRMALHAKNLAFKEIEVTPGIGQISLFRLSGQRQVPVLVDGEKVITDSTLIIRHLEEYHPQKPLIPHDPKFAAHVHLIEDWADTTLAKAAKSALIQAAAIDTELRLGLLPKEIPDPLQKVMEGFPFRLMNEITGIFSKREHDQLFSSLEQLSLLVQNKPWLIGDEMSIADLSVAAQLSLLCFPTSSGENLKGKGIPGISDHPLLQPLFQWQDQLVLSLHPTKPN